MVTSTPMQKRTILISGCSSGIGRCVALGLHERGYQVFAGVRKSADRAALEAAGLQTVQLDLDNSTSIRNAVAEVIQQTDGRLDALFNNGAFGQPGAVEDLSRQALREQFETNLFGTHELTCAVIPVMRRQGYGRIIQNSSLLGFVALKYRGAYIASKFALEGLSDTLRLELADANIQVSLIEPGPISSDFRANALRALRRHIDTNSSAHREIYKSVLARLESKESDIVPFTLGADAVLGKVIHALESRHAKPRYYVTQPAYMFGFLKRILPVRIMDWLLIKASGAENATSYKDPVL